MVKRTNVFSFVSDPILCILAGSEDKHYILNLTSSNCGHFEPLATEVSEKILINLFFSVVSIYIQAIRSCIKS